MEHIGRGSWLVVAKLWMRPFLGSVDLEFWFTAATELFFFFFQSINVIIFFFLEQDTFLFLVTVLLLTVVTCTHFFTVIVDFITLFILFLLTLICDCLLYLYLVILNFF